MVDANVIVSVLLKNSQTRQLLLSDKFLLEAPIFIQEELFKYLDEFSIRLGCEKQVLKEALEELFLAARIEVFSSDFYSDFSTEAKSLISDSKDTAYLALALKLNYSIGSQDQGFKKQNQIPVYATQDLIRLKLDNP